MATTVAEFSINKSWESNRQGPIRWLLSHVLRHKIYIIGVFIGAFGNGMGAGLVPLYIGQGFNIIVNSGDVRALGWVALSLIGTRGSLAPW